MTQSLQKKFIQEVNQNLGIAHKVCSVYFIDWNEREDILQEMIYQLWKSYERFDGRSKFSTWMYRVCLNTALTYRRKTKNAKYESLSNKHFEIPERSNQPQEENIKLLYQAIALLSPINKAIILLYLDDLSYEEIASITGFTKANVGVRLVRIKKELEMQFKKLNTEEDVKSR